MKGRFVLVDGADGSGKGTVVEAFRAHHEHVFDLARFLKEHHRYPALDEVKQDVILSVEPTDVMVGQAIKHEILRGERKFSGLVTAHAFALDRDILYHRFLLPALKAGKHVIQERGVTTSLVYQPIQLEKLSLRDVMNIPGNMTAIKNAPAHLVIVKADPDRIAARARKGSIFDSVFFQRKVEERYESEWLAKVFERFSAKVHYLDGDCPRQELVDKATALYRDVIIGGQKSLA